MDREDRVGRTGPEQLAGDQVHGLRRRPLAHADHDGPVADRLHVAALDGRAAPILLDATEPDLHAAVRREHRVEAVDRLDTSEAVRIVHSNPLVGPALRYRHPVVAGQDGIDERVVGEKKVEYRTILGHHVDGEADRLLEHRLPKLIGELGETLAIDSVVLFEAAKAQPVARELVGQAPHAFVAKHAPGLRNEHFGLCRSPPRHEPAVPHRACSPTGSNSAGWPGRSPAAAASPCPAQRRSSR